MQKKNQHIIIKLVERPNRWERSSVWLERMPVTHEVASSSLVVPAIKEAALCGFFNGCMLVVRTVNCEFGGFADGRSIASPDSEQIEPAELLGSKAKLCERGANPRQASSFPN